MVVVVLDLSEVDNRLVLLVVLIVTALELVRLLLVVKVLVVVVESDFVVEVLVVDGDFVTILQADETAVRLMPCIGDVNRGLKKRKNPSFQQTLLILTDSTKTDRMLEVDQD